MFLQVSLDTMNPDSIFGKTISLKVDASTEEVKDHFKSHFITQVLHGQI